MQREGPSRPASTILAPLRNRVFRSVWTATRIADLGRLVQAVCHRLSVWRTSR
nr:MFS transporter [Mesorhizobium amorphae]